jgi:hypothetical protein
MNFQRVTTYMKTANIHGELEVKKIMLYFAFTYNTTKPQYIGYCKNLIFYRAPLIIRCLYHL